MIPGRSRLSVVPVVVSLAIAALVITGCSSSDLPNAAPLSVPPDYTLRPPRPGMPTTQQVSSTQQAQTTRVFRMGDNTLGALPPAKSRSPGETSLLEEAGAQNVPKDIRQLVNNDERGAMNSATLTERLLSWHQPTTPHAGPQPTIEPATSNNGKGFFDWF